jgi:hypothetical protein
MAEAEVTELGDVRRPRGDGRRPTRLSWPTRLPPWVEPLLYGLVAGIVTLWVATRFYGSLKLQLVYAHAWASHDDFSRFIEDSGFWSAPLDDVFIHFDFARSIVRGHPFEWSSGAGYSSGGTSLLYPFVLALGIPLGFDGLRLMVTEKRRDIGILCALGGTPGGILSLFLLIALWEALIGATLGVVFGVWGAIEIDGIERWLSANLDIQIFNRDVYLFDHIPSIVDPRAVVVIVAGAFACALLFAAVPALRAARLDPLEALRYE